MFRRITRPETQFSDAQDVAIYQTNGTARVSLTVTDETAPRRERVTLSLTPDDAIELAVSLLLGATNVQAGLHGNSEAALDIYEGPEAEVERHAEKALRDWIARRARERELIELRERLGARDAETADIIAAQAEREEAEVPECDECEEEATNFWPNLREPVQLCDSCEHNARRSGWEPGQ